MKDYYKEGVPLEKSMKVVLGLLDKDRDVVYKVLKDFSALNLISRNLESLGFLKYTHPPATPEVTLRGGTFILSRRPYLFSRVHQESIQMEMARFVLLKAIRDSDWECFREFYSARFIETPGTVKSEKDIREFIRSHYYPRFSPINFYHWYRLHISFLEETTIEKILAGKDNKKRIFNLLDPYSEFFSADEFFSRRLKKPAVNQLTAIVKDALSIYKKNLMEQSLIGHCETLKSIIQILLLDSGLFENEIQLSGKVISILRKKKISFMRSNYPTLTEGRGFIDKRRTEQTSFKLFSFTHATLDDDF